MPYLILSMYTMRSSSTLVRPSLADNCTKSYMNTTGNVAYLARATWGTCYPGSALCIACHIEMVIANSSHRCKPCHDCKLIAGHFYSHPLHSPMQGLIACAVQCFYAWRVKIITGKIWVVVIIAAMAIISMRELFFLLTLVK